MAKKKMPKLKIETAKVADLLPYANNAKLHTHEQVDQIAASMSEFGNNDPIAVWHNADGEMEIVEGHGRVMALKKLGIEECPVIYLDHLSDEQRRAYTHVHNMTNMSTGFDFDVLNADVAELESFEWEDFGFDMIAVSEPEGGDEVPSEFKEYDEDIETENKCPMCGYEW